MNRTIHTFIFVALLTILPSIGYSQIKLPSILSNGMVLQQRSAVTLWGWASAGEAVSVQASWLRAPVKTVADAQGNWSLKLETIEAGGPHTLEITGKNQVVLSNVLLGEVWFCSGQSNMEFTLNMLGGFDSIYPAQKQELLAKDYSRIRLCTISKRAADKPVDTCSAQWQEANVKTLGDFSATAWFYAKYLYDSLQLPIGLISSSWGGSPIEAWTPEADIVQHPQLKWFKNEPNSSQWWPGKPGAIYNAMVHPFINYAIKGAIWYQGETNRLDADVYALLMHTMISSWRSKWNCGDFPFYYVQIAPYRYDDNTHSSGFLREAQSKALTLANTGMAVTMDIGNLSDIHPKNKMEVGRRLGLLALANTYGRASVACKGPAFAQQQIEGDKIRLKFDDAEGLWNAKPELQGFMLGNSEKFIKANAKVAGNDVVVWHPDIPNPKYVRYAFDDTTSSSLYNKAGLPCPSFRTDDLPFNFRRSQLHMVYDSISGDVVAEISCKDPKQRLFYQVNNQAINPYYLPFRMSGSFKLTAWAGASVGNLSALPCQASYVKHLATHKTIVQHTPPSERYAATKGALIDGFKGPNEYWDKAWQGFEAQDLEMIVDLGKPTQIQTLSLGAMEKVKDWILLPNKIECSTSMDGINFENLVVKQLPEPANTKGVVLHEIMLKLKTNARFIKIKAFNHNTMPQWHPGKGGKAWMFFDEVSVN
jgi:sialate O-acetylesterase